jgi:DNA-binding beta-propeller fold protein YncE
MARLRNQLIASVALLGAISASSAASAQSAIIALTGENNISLINPSSMKVTSSVAAKGVKKLLGIDVRPADNMLYGVTDNGWVVTIDPKTGTVTQKAELSTKPSTNAVVTVDFNPAADRLRIITSDGMNLRANVDDGKVTVDGDLKFAETDMHKGEKPNIVGGAYTNSWKGTKETALYDIDATIGALFKQAPPNDGVLAAVGKLGFKPNGPIAFNIVSESEGKNAAWLVSGSTVYSVDLTTGAAKEAGKIQGLKGAVRDIGWWSSTPPKATM